MSSTSLSSYSSLVTDIQANGAFPTTSAFVNGGPNATSGAFQFQSFAVIEFDPSNSTIYPDYSTVPLNPGTVAGTATGGTISSASASTTIYFKYTVTTANGESLPSPEISINFAKGGTATNTATLTLPGIFPAGTTGVKVYASTSSGTEKLQTTLPNTPQSSFTLTAAPTTTGASVPTTNTANPATTTITTPTGLTLSLVNNPTGYNSVAGVQGNLATGSFDAYLLPTYVAPIGSNLVYQTATATGLPLGLQGQGGLSGVTSSNFLLASNFTAGASGPLTVPLTLPTGTVSAATTLTTDLQNNLPFEIAIVPHTGTSSAQFQGNYEAVNNFGNATGAPNGLMNDQALNESPKLSLTSNSAVAASSAVSETFTLPYPAISVNQNNVSSMVEIDVIRTGYAGDAATISYTTTDGTAKAGTDFGTSGTAGPVTGTVSFAAGQTDSVIVIPTIPTSIAGDISFSVALNTPTSVSGVPVSFTTAPSTVTIIGATHEADNIGGSVTDTSGNNSFILGASASSVQLVKPAVGTYAPVVGSVDDGADVSNNNTFNNQQYEVLSFAANALQQSQKVTGLTSLSLELDNYSSVTGTYSDGTAFPSQNPIHVGNFNVYLLNSSVTSVPTSGFAFEGQDTQGGGIFTQGVPLLLGTASFSNQDTTRSNKSGLGNTEGIQDTYTLNLTPTAQALLIADLNSSSTLSPGTVRLALTAGDPAFAADFANNNSGTGGNYGIQPYLFFSGSTTTAQLPPENISVNYSNINVGSNENVVAVDVTRPASGFVGDTATVNFTLADGTAKQGTDYSAPASYMVTIPINQTTGTVLIPLIPHPAATAEKSFTISLTGASTTSSSGGNGDTFALDTTDPTTITITPPLAVTATAQSDNNGTAQVSAASLFNGYAIINGSVANGTGSFAFQGFQVLEYTPSSFVGAGQQLTSLSNISLGLSNYENQQSAPGSNYGGPAGNFTMYVVVTPESTAEYTPSTGFNIASASGGDPAIFNSAYSDGIGGFTGVGTGGTGPQAATTLINVGTATFPEYAIPVGVASFNTKLGVDYFTPTQAALNKAYTFPDPITGATVTESALAALKTLINNGKNIRLLAAPGSPAFHAYFYGSNTGANSGGPGAPTLQVVDTVSTVKTAETVGFGSTSYNVSNAGGTITIPVTRSVLTDSGTGLNDTVTVSYATSDGNATSGTNYAATSGTLTFAPGVTTQNITIPITAVANLTGDKAFTLTLTTPATSNTTSYVAPALTNNATTTVYITTNANNAQTLTQYNSAVGDIGTNGPVTFGGSALNPAPPFNFSIYTGGRYAALDFNDNTVSGFNIPGEFNGPTGPITPTGPADGSGNPTYSGPASEPLGTGPVVYTPAGNGSLYSSTIANINQITLAFVNYYNSTPGDLLNVYLVTDAASNILPGAGGTAKNPHFYDTSVHNITANLGDGVGTQFGTTYVLGTITNPSPQSAVNFNGYTVAPLTSFNATAENLLIGYLNSGTKFRLVVAPESSSTAQNADWIYGYVNANPSYAAATGLPINYYVNPELSFDVSYTSTNAALPSYITPSANANYVYDSTTGNLTVTNGSLTINPDLPSDTTDLNISQLHITSNGPTAQVLLDTTQLTASGVTTQNGGTVTGLTTPAWLSPAGGAVYGYNPFTQNLQVISGTVTIIADPAAYAALPNVTVIGSSSTVVVNTAANGLVHLGSVTLQGGAKMTVTTLSSPQVLVVAPGSTDLSIDSQSRLDLGNSVIDLQVGTGSTTPLSTVNGYVASGYNHGLFTGTGIVSSVAAADKSYKTSVGDTTGAKFAGTIPGLTVGAADVVVRETYYGDANLDGKVDGSDYTLTDNGFNSHLSGWSNGDFNFDQVIDGSDYTLIDNAFNTQGSPLPADLIASATSQIASTGRTGKPSGIVIGKAAATTAAVFSQASPPLTVDDVLKKTKSGSRVADDILDHLGAR